MTVSGMNRNLKVIMAATTASVTKLKNAVISCRIVGDVETNAHSFSEISASHVKHLPASFVLLEAQSFQVDMACVFFCRARKSR